MSPPLAQSKRPAESTTAQSPFSKLTTWQSSLPPDTCQSRMTPFQSAVTASLPSGERAPASVPTWWPGKVATSLPVAASKMGALLPYSSNSSSQRLSGENIVWFEPFWRFSQSSLPVAVSYIRWAWVTGPAGSGGKSRRSWTVRYRLPSGAMVTSITVPASVAVDRSLPVARSQKRKVLSSPPVSAHASLGKIAMQPALPS